MAKKKGCPFGQPFAFLVLCSFLTRSNSSFCPNMQNFLNPNKKDKANKGNANKRELA
jgi:hypothetical protein